MKFSHGELEKIRSDAVAYARKGPKSDSFFGVSAFRIWQLSTRIYHKNDDDLTKAKIYLQTNFWKNFKRNRGNDKRLQTWDENLRKYSKDFARLEHHVIDAGKRITIRITEQVTMGGEIPRVDLVTDGGYSVYLFTKIINNWTEELRMPLLQDFYAKLLGAPINEVSIGVYCLETAKHYSRTFNRTAIEDAKEEVNEIAKILERESRSKLSTFHGSFLLKPPIHMSSVLNSRKWLQ